MAWDKLNLRPRTIGYWARANDISLSDLLATDSSQIHPDVRRRIQKALASAEAQKEFHDGWQRADKELKDEAFETFLKQLS
jgi:hypothetical protein